MSDSARRTGVPAEGWARPTLLIGARSPGWWIAGLLLLVLAAGIRLGLTVLPPGPWFHSTDGLGTILLAWDGGWYDHIAQHGYSWNAAIGTHIGNYQSVAFFPLYPLIEHALTDLTGSSAPLLMVLPGALFGIVSIPLFLRLAQRLLPGPDAMWATLLYALYPAVNFYLMGYPTGLMNLLAILALLDIMDGRRWRAAMWCGIGTAAGPPIVFIAIVLCADQGLTWLRASRSLRALPGLLAFGLLTTSGLIAYIAYQWIALGDPRAFLASQSAWGSAPALSARLARLVSPGWYFANIGQYAEGSFHALATLHITKRTAT